MSYQQKRPQRPRQPAAHQLEADVLEGLEALCAQELVDRFGGDVYGGTTHAGRLRFSFARDLRALLSLRTATALYLALPFDVPRPKALLGHQHFERIVDAVEQVRALHPDGAFQTLRLSAAGEDSSVLTRLKHELAQRTGLEPAADEGDALLRLRRMPDSPGWELLMRLSPRPLATRAWRVCNMPGAPNATLAAAIALLTAPAAQDNVLNICCGSGSLLVERLALGRTRTATGCDTSAEALACARQNLEAAGYADQTRLEPWDATALPLPDASADVIIADLPFGQLVGSHRENEALYPGLVREATRVAAADARMALLTHEVRLLERVLEDYRGAWRPAGIVPVRSGGMMPRIFLLERLA